MPGSAKGCQRVFWQGDVGDETRAHALLGKTQRAFGMFGRFLPRLAHYRRAFVRIGGAMARQFASQDVRVRLAPPIETAAEQKLQPAASAPVPLPDRNEAARAVGNGAGGEASRPHEGAASPVRQRPSRTPPRRARASWRDRCSARGRSSQGGGRLRPRPRLESRRRARELRGDPHRVRGP